MANKSEFKCVLCNCIVSGVPPGNLRCSTHVKPYNHFYSSSTEFPINHYECCGFTDNWEDSNHYEFSSVKGCHRIDHVRTHKELYEIINSRPFDLVPGVYNSHPEIITRFYSADQLLVDNFELSVSYKSQPIKLNIKQEYETFCNQLGIPISSYLRRKLGLEFQIGEESECPWNPKEFHSSYYYIYPESILDSKGFSKQVHFVPFTIVRRVSSQPFTRALLKPCTQY